MSLKLYFSVWLLVIGYFLISVITPFRFGGIFLFIGGILFLYYLYKSGFKLSIKEEFKPLSFWILTFLGVIIMALISTHFAFNTKETLKMILVFLIFPFMLTLYFYFLIKNMSQKALKLFLILLGIAIISHPIATIYDFASNFSNHDIRATGFNEELIIPYSIFLILSLALSISLAFLLKGYYKLLGILLVLICLFSMFANGSRALIFCFLIMLIASLLLFSYAYKKIILPSSIIILILISITTYFYSTKLSLRYDVKNIIDHLGIVLKYTPAEMGRFDKNCFKEKSDYICSSFSGKNIDKRFSFDVSTLNRLSLNKSGLEAILQNPFRPNGYYSRFFAYNLSNIFKPNSINYPYPINKTTHISYYDHIHDMILSFIFELGVVGFLFVAFNFIWVLTKTYQKFITTSYNYQKIFTSAYILFLLGFSISMLFDSMLSFPKFNYIFFALQGIILGLIFRKNKDIKDINDL